MNGGNQRRRAETRQKHSQSGLHSVHHYAAGRPSLSERFQYQSRSMRAHFFNYERRRWLGFYLLGAVLEARSASARPQQVAAAPGLGSCYYPGNDADWAQNQHPCNLHSEISACCPTGWTCFSNFLCIATDPDAASASLGDTRRGTCTDPTWNEETCGSFCLDGDDQDGDMTACGNDTWCCSSDSSCDCDSGKGTFTVNSGKALGIVGFVDGHITLTTGSAVPTSTGTVVKPSRHASHSATASSTTRSSSPTSSPSSTTASAAAASSTASAASSTISNSPDASSAAVAASSSSSSRLGKILGPIFGILGLALVLGLSWFCWRRRKGHRDREDTTPSPPLESSAAPFVEKEAEPIRSDAPSGGQAATGAIVNARHSNTDAPPMQGYSSAPPPPPPPHTRNYHPPQPPHTRDPQAPPPPLHSRTNPMSPTHTGPVFPKRTNPQSPMHANTPSPMRASHMSSAQPQQPRLRPPPPLSGQSKGYSPIFGSRSSSSVPAQALAGDQRGDGTPGQAPILNPSQATTTTMVSSDVGSSASQRQRSIPRKPVTSPAQSQHPAQ